MASEGFAYGGPTGIVGPWLERGGGTASYIVSALPLFNLAISIFLFRVGLCSHGIFLLQVTWLHRTRWIFSRSIDRVDPSPRDRNQRTCVKIIISGFDERLTW